jgi:hypothetical protein
VSEESMAHLVSWGGGGLKAVQPFHLEVFRQNLRTLLPTVVWLMVAGVKCMIAGSGTVAEDFIKRAEDVRERAFVLLTPTEKGPSLP